jgi:hypothetical protein
VSETKRCVARNPLDCDYPTCRCEDGATALPETAPMTDSADRGHPMSDASLRHMYDEYGERSDPPYALVGMLAGEVLALRAATVSAGRLREAAIARLDGLLETARGDETMPVRPSLLRLVRAALSTEEG